MHLIHWADNHGYAKRGLFQVPSNGTESLEPTKPMYGPAVTIAGCQLAIQIKP